MSLHPAVFLIERLQIPPSDALPLAATQPLYSTVKMMYSILFRLVSGGKLLFRMSTAGCHFVLLPMRNIFVITRVVFVGSRRK